MSSLILGIDTAVGGMSVSLLRGDTELAGFADPAQQDQAALLLPTIESVLAEAGTAYADLDGIAVTVGPGGFTGVRIGLAAARGIAFATGKKLRGITTLALLAEACPTRPLVAAIPAGRGAFYTQYYRSHDEPEAPGLTEAAALAESCAGASVACPPGAWLDSLSPAIGVIAHDHRRNARLAATIAGRLGFTGEWPEAAPLYIRPPDAKPQRPLV